MRGNRGISLIEVLVAMTIFSIVVVGVMKFGDYVSRRILTVRNDVDEMDRLVGFLKVFSRDVRGARQILYSAPAEVGVWRADENADSAAEPAETIGYAWDGESPGNIYRQEGEDTAIVLSDVRDLKFTYDRESPQTRHVILDVSVGKLPADVRQYHFSINLRVYEIN